MTETETDLQRERYRLDAYRPVPGQPDAAGSPAMVGQVVTTAAPGKFLDVNPVDVGGDETTGAPGEYSAGTALVSVLNIGPGTPAVGALLVCRFVNYRWVTGLSVHGGTPCLLRVSVYDSSGLVVYPATVWVYYDEADGTAYLDPSLDDTTLGPYSITGPSGVDIAVDGSIGVYAVKTTSIPTGTTIKFQFACQCVTTFAAYQCGNNVLYPGVSIVVTQGMTTVYSCTTTSDPDLSACVWALKCGETYTITATDPNGVVQVKTYTPTFGGVALKFYFITQITAIATDSCGNLLSGVVFHFSAPGGWSQTCTTDGSGTCTVAPTVDLTGLTVTWYATYMGATSRGGTFAPINAPFYARCGSVSASFVKTISVVVEGCFNLPLEGALVVVTGAGGSTGTGTTGADGTVVITLSPPIPIDIFTALSFTISKSRFITQSAARALCGLPDQPICGSIPDCFGFGLLPDSGHICVCNCPDPAPLTLFLTDPAGARNIAYDPVFGWWWAVFTILVDAYDYFLPGSSECAATGTMQEVSVYCIFNGCTLTYFMKCCEGTHPSIFNVIYPPPTFLLQPGVVAYSPYTVVGDPDFYQAVTCPPGLIYEAGDTSVPIAAGNCFAAIFGAGSSDVYEINE